MVKVVVLGSDAAHVLKWRGYGNLTPVYAFLVVGFPAVGVEAADAAEIKHGVIRVSAPKFLQLTEQH